MSRCKTLVFALALLLCATPTFAGYLDADATAYAGWHGTTPFFANPDFNGYIEWAVYAPGTWPASFDFGAFTPDTGNLLYAYQVFSEGPDPASLTLIAVNGETYDPGLFTGTGVSASVDGEAPTSSNATSFVSAFWTFDGLFGPSKGLFFTSPNIPEEGSAFFQDGGSSAIGFPVPSPSPFDIPEPTTWTLALFGLAGLTAAAVRRRARAKA
jgi:hypothetical protein